jgi:hypothetical protein
MRFPSRNVLRPAAGLVLAGILASSWTTGCASGTRASSFLPLPLFRAFTGTGDTGPIGGGGGGDDSGFFGGGGRGSLDPCEESQNRKFVRISMRNLDADDSIHYFLLMIAFVNGDVHPDGAVCPDDTAIYTSFGYSEIADGASREFGNVCIVGPALVYFHEGGRFRSPTGTLASGIGPALGSQPTFDSFFTSAGALVPVPNRIIFHNPGTGDGAFLKISVSDPAPCFIAPILGDPECAQDAFYYVDDNDLLIGSTGLGIGSGRRTPSEIQGTGCECLGFDEAFHTLAPSSADANALCNEFLRGSRIDYVFLRQDTMPPFPQLLWRVTGLNGGVVHAFDSRGGTIP